MIETVFEKKLKFFYRIVNRVLRSIVFILDPISFLYNKDKKARESYA